MQTFVAKTTVETFNITILPRTTGINVACFNLVFAKKRLYITMAPGDNHPDFDDTLYYDYDYGSPPDASNLNWVAGAINHLTDEEAAAVLALLRDRGESK